MEKEKERDRQRGILCSKSFATSLAEQQRRFDLSRSPVSFDLFSTPILRERERGERRLERKKKKEAPLKKSWPVLFLEFFFMILLFVFL